MALQPKKLKKNIEGFRDHLGIFHPIRSGNKEQGRLYDAGAAGDYDFPAERQERRERNQEKADQIYQERLLKEALDGALGEERKFSLSQFVRKSGGLKYDPTGKTTKSGKKDSWYGELATFSFKETGKKGLAHKNGKYGVDGMREQANEAGYPNMQTEADFLDALSKDLRTGDIYPFFSADYMTNPTTPATVFRGKAAEIAKAIKFFTKRGKTVKAKTLEKARTIALSLAKKAEATMTTSPKTKKRTTAKTAKNPTAKKPAAKKTATKRPRKNGIIETAAALAVGTSAAVGLFDRATKGAKVSSKPNRAAALKHNSGNTAFHEKEFHKLIVQIEKGDLRKITGAKSQAKSAGYSQREADELTDRARLRYKLTKNPAKVDLTAAHKLVHNGRLKQFFARKSAVRHYNRQLRLEQQLERAKAKRAKSESAAKKKNPAQRPRKSAQPALNFKTSGHSPAFMISVADLSKPKYANLKRAGTDGEDVYYVDSLTGNRYLTRQNNPAKNPAKPATKRSQSYYDFQGRETTKTLEVLRPEAAPRHTYCLGVLLELRLKNHKNLNFRRESCGKTYYVAADEKNKQIWILGGKVAAADSSIAKDFSVPIAEITHIVYSTHKAHLDDVKNQGYIHEFGEEGGERPTLARDRNGFPIIQGGDYTITPLGIAN